MDIRWFQAPPLLSAILGKVNTCTDAEVADESRKYKGACIH